MQRIQSAAVSSNLPYLNFQFPLNVFMFVLTQEEGGVRHLHYGLFDSDDESIEVAQERSTRLLLEHIPPSPARLLEVGIGLGTTLKRLLDSGYDAEGITPDLAQIEMARAAHGDLPVHGSTFENFAPRSRFDAIVFQESSQYIDAATLFSRARRITNRVVVLDEFALRVTDPPAALHSLERFLSSAAENGFRKEKEIDLSRKAAPTVGYFMRRLPAYRQPLIENLNLTQEQIDELLRSGRDYVERYEDGTYGYRLLTFAA
jgi:hypothetical protein